MALLVSRSTRVIFSCHYAGGPVCFFSGHNLWICLGWQLTHTCILEGRNNFFVIVFFSVIISGLSSQEFHTYESFVNFLQYIYTIKSGKVRVAVYNVGWIFPSTQTRHQSDKSGGQVWMVTRQGRWTVEWKVEKSNPSEQVKHSFTATDTLFTRP